jgi:hypothetical protein
MNAPPRDARVRRTEFAVPPQSAGLGEAAIAFSTRPPIVAVGSTFIALLALNLMAIPILYSSDSYVVGWVCQLFVFNDEANIPTLFNFLLLVGNGFLLALAALRAFGAADP